MWPLPSRPSLLLATLVVTPSRSNVGLVMYGVGCESVVDGQWTRICEARCCTRGWQTEDLTQEDGQWVAQRVVATSDVFVENLSPVGSDRLGLSVDPVASANPEVVWSSLDGNGETWACPGAIRRMI